MTAEKGGFLGFCGNDLNPTARVILADKFFDHLFVYIVHVQVSPPDPLPAKAHRHHEFCGMPQQTRLAQTRDKVTQVTQLFQSDGIFPG
jgi:hypothetical protein